MAKLWQFSQGHPKPAFCEKVQRGDQGKFFQKSPKKWPYLQKPNSTLAQMALSSKLYPLIMQRLNKSLAQKAAPKRPEWPSYGNFCNVTQDPLFLKRCKGGTKRNFSKIAQKVALVWKAEKHSGANNIILYLVCAWSAKTAKDLSAQSGSKSARMAKLWQISNGHPKPTFFWKRGKGRPREIFQISPKK